MKDNQETNPYQRLGSKLRALREKRSESLAEVSGAVEIDIEDLTAIEQGKKRPAEEILALLVSYFDAKEETAAKLFEMAGYTKERQNHGGIEQEFSMQPAIMVMPMDARIVYTDQVHVMVNNYGVVMNFMQLAGPNNQPIAVSRVGMSREHARSIIDLLQKTLAHSEPKQLPPATTDSEKTVQ